MTSVSSWQNSINLCPVSFSTPRPSLPVTPGISRLPTEKIAQQFSREQKRCSLCIRCYTMRPVYDLQRIKTQFSLFLIFYIALYLINTFYYLNIFIYILITYNERVYNVLVNIFKSHRKIIIFPLIKITFPNFTVCTFF